MKGARSLRSSGGGWNINWPGGPGFQAWGMDSQRAPRSAQSQLARYDSNQQLEDEIEPPSSQNLGHPAYELLTSALLGMQYTWSSAQRGAFVLLEVT